MRANKHDLIDRRNYHRQCTISKKIGFAHDHSVLLGRHLWRMRPFMKDRGVRPGDGKNKALTHPETNPSVF